MERLSPGQRLVLPVGASPQITICRSEQLKNVTQLFIRYPRRGYHNSSLLTPHSSLPTANCCATYELAVFAAYVPERRRCRQSLSPGLLSAKKVETNISECCMIASSQGKRGNLMQPDSILIRGLRQNNLKNVSLDIPKGKIVVFTGCPAPANPASSLTPSPPRASGR